MKSPSTTALIKGLKQMLENRGSMTVEEVQLLSNVVNHLEEHENLKGDEKLHNGVRIVELLLRFLLNPAISQSLADFTSTLIDKLN